MENREKSSVTKFFFPQGKRISAQVFNRPKTHLFHTDFSTVCFSTKGKAVEAFKATNRS